ncbi:MAG: FtsX-like permease family protein [Clostridia bacterium]|nr:FtsX-like permease family protein [Clostridia bacterium]
MHFMQSIKMACKSLWTNKIRSFLTMLGIIIGVFSISLLITVTQSFSNVIISSIRTKSTLSIMLNISDKLTNKNANNIISNVQPKDKNVNDYFDYTLISATTSLVANDSLECFDGDMIADFLTADRIYTMEDFENYDSMTPEEQAIVKLLLMKKKGSLKANVYDIDEKFRDIYDFKYQGDYLSGSNDILVDRIFIDTYFGTNVSNEEAVGRVITLGVTNYTNIKLIYKEPLKEFKINSIMSMITKEYEVETGKDLDGNPIKNKVSLSILNNEDGTNYTYTEVQNEDGSKSYELSINVDIIKYFTNDDLKELFNEKSKEPQYAHLFKDSEMFLKDIYEKDDTKEFKIVGVVDDSNNSLITDVFKVQELDKKEGSSSEEKESVVNTFMKNMNSSRGNCYLLLDDSNAKCLYQDKELTKDKTIVSLAYFKYKSEDVMASSTANLIVSFVTSGYGFMSEFVLVSFNTVANIVSNIMEILTVLLLVISFVSLLVGGIGIMNIMLVSVSERTKEIGIRKAIGARKSNILIQFLIESLFISLVGCVFGLIFSGIGILIISSIVEFTLIMPLWVILMSVGFCLFIGLAFGMFPAIKASNMQPIDALRRE